MVEVPGPESFEDAQYSVLQDACEEARAKERSKLQGEIDGLKLQLARKVDVVTEPLHDEIKALGVSEDKAWRETHRLRGFLDRREVWIDCLIRMLERRDRG